MTPSKPRRNNWFMILGCIFGICLAGFGLLIFAALLPPINSSPTSTTTPLAEPIIIQTTEIVLTSTQYILPTLTKPATSPPLETLSPTATVIFILPTNAPSGSIPGICSCSGDTLNCADFPDGSSAQACFEYCMQQGAGDINKLDQDNDGDACEAN